MLMSGHALEVPLSLSKCLVLDSPYAFCLLFQVEHLASQKMWPKNGYILGNKVQLLKKENNL